MAALLAHSSTKRANQARQQECSAICALEDQPDSKLLFGNDLVNNLKDAKEASSLSFPVYGKVLVFWKQKISCE